MAWTPEELQIINLASEACLQLIFKVLTVTRGVHIETAINLAGSLAGVSILRSAVKAERIDLSNLIRTAPGSPIFIEQANTMGSEVANFMIGCCKSQGIDRQTGWTQDIPEANEPQRPSVEMVRDYEKSFVDLMDEQKLVPEFRPYVAAFAAVKLVAKGAQVLNPDIGKAIALASMVAASKTIPLV